MLLDAPAGGGYLADRLPSDVDYVALLKAATKGRDLIRAYAYSGLDPEKDVMTLYLRDQAVATSGIDRRRWQRKGVWQHHLIDPRTGRPSHSDLESVVVVGNEVMWAEVYAKAALIAGADVAGDLVTGAGMTGLLVTRSQQVVELPGLEEFRP